MEETPFLFFYTMCRDICKRVQRIFFLGFLCLCAAMLWRTAVLFAGIAAITCCTGKPEVCITTRDGTIARVKVELARTPSERSLGLMYRSRLANGHGMLFIADHEAVQSFTMRNTLISLDMIFIGSDMRIAGVIEHAQPMHEGPFTISAPSRYVLEVPAGFCNRHGICRGDVVAFVHIIP